MSDTLPQEVREGAFRLGVDLVAPGQFIHGAIDQLNINLAAIGCEPSVDPVFVRGSWQTVSFTPKSPPVSRAIRAAASSIIWRPESLADTLPPPGSVLANEDPSHASAAWVPLEEVDLTGLLRDSTEGVMWENPNGAKNRRNIAENNATILREFIGGLASNGYSAHRSRGDIREEFDEILDSLVLRTSYHCIVERRVVARIMRRAGITNALSPFYTIRRYGRAAFPR